MNRGIFSAFLAIALAVTISCGGGNSGSDDEDQTNWLIGNWSMVSSNGQSLDTQGLQKVVMALNENSSFAITYTLLVGYECVQSGAWEKVSSSIMRMAIESNTCNAEQTANLLVNYSLTNNNNTLNLSGGSGSSVWTRI